MKIIQISDLHLIPSGQKIFGLNPEDRLVAVIDSINANHSDAEFCVISGDLAETGDPQAYRLLKQHLKQLRMPIHLMIGNHDNRDVFRAEFPETSCDQNGFVQSVVVRDDCAFVLLDTVRQGAAWGEFCQARGGWLAKQLDEHRDRAVYIFMHHPPFDIGIPKLDAIRIRETEHFDHALKPAENVKHIFFGHVHRPVVGSCSGIPFSAIPAQNHQVKLDLRGQDRIRYCHEPPMIGVVLADKHQTVLHYDNHLDTSLIEKLGGAGAG